MSINIHRQPILSSAHHKNFPGFPFRTTPNTLADRRQHAVVGGLLAQDHQDIILIRLAHDVLAHLHRLRPIEAAHNEREGNDDCG